MRLGWWRKRCHKFKREGLSDRHFSYPVVQVLTTMWIATITCEKGQSFVWASFTFPRTENILHKNWSVAFDRDDTKKNLDHHRVVESMKGRNGEKGRVSIVTWRFQREKIWGACATVSYWVLTCYRCLAHRNAFETSSSSLSRRFRHFFRALIYDDRDDILKFK